MKLLIIYFLLGLICCGSVTAQNSRATALNEIVAAEQTFARTAEERGTRAAFLEFAAADAVVFSQTKPENAQEYWTKHAELPGLLAWQPTWADAAADGTLGYTTGNWEFRPKGRNESAVAWGEYFTIWKRGSGGKWKFEFDIGIDHGESAVVRNVWKSPVNNSAALGQTAHEQWKILERQFEFSNLLKNGVEQTYQKFGSNEIRLLRENQLPLQGKNNALAFIKNNGAPPPRFKILNGGGSLNLLYAYGEYETASKENQILEKGYYIRVWKREPAGWRVAIDLAHSVPLEKK